MLNKFNKFYSTFLLNIVLIMAKKKDYPISPLNSLKAIMIFKNIPRRTTNIRWHFIFKTAHLFSYLLPFLFRKCIIIIRYFFFKEIFTPM